MIMVVDEMKRIYVDTTIVRHIARIGDEAEGWDYGDYEWVYRHYGDKPELVSDIKALCYIIALVHEWNLEFCPSNASYYELCKSIGNRARKARETWELFVETQTNERLSKNIEKTPQGQLLDFGKIRDRLEIISDPKDREILRDFLKSGADVLLTTDYKHLANKQKRHALASIGINVMRPAEWLDLFLKELRGDEDAVDCLERILFSVEKL